MTLKTNYKMKKRNTATMRMRSEVSELYKKMGRRFRLVGSTGRYDTSNTSYSCYIMTRSCDVAYQQYRDVPTTASENSSFCDNLCLT